MSGGRWPSAGATPVPTPLHPKPQNRGGEMRSTRIGVGLTATVLAVALGASACSSSKSTSTPKAAPKSSVNDINPVDRSKLKQGGTLTWPIDQFSTQWNYNEVDGPEVSTADVVGALLPSPFHTD